MYVAMQLPPWLSLALINAVGFHVSEIEHLRTYMLILDHIYTSSVDEVQAILRRYGEDAKNQPHKKTDSRHSTLLSIFWFFTCNVT